MRGFVRTGLVAALCLAAAAQGSVVSKHGRLKIQNKKVVDSAGTPIQLAGMSIYWSTFGSGTSGSWGANAFFNSGVVSTLANDWKSTLVRAPAGVISGSGQNVYNYPQTMNLVKQVVDAAIANDIYVIVDWHLENSTPSQTEATQFFTEMSQAYRSTPNIIWEIWNEPKNVDWSSIKSYANAIIPIIRQNSSNLIVVGTPNWSHNPDAAANDPITSDPDIAYALHFYAAQNCDGKVDADNNSAMAVANSALQKVPLMLTEWGTVCNSGAGSVNTSWSDKWLDWAKTNGISWANWSLSNKSESSAALQTSASANGGWADNQLSTSGAYVRGKIREVFNGLPTSSIQGAPRSAAGGFPVRGDVRGVAVRAPAGALRIEVLDLSGRILASAKASADEQVIPVDVRGLVLVRSVGEQGSVSAPVLLAR